MTTVTPSEAHSAESGAASILPGLALTSAIALASFALHALPGMGLVSPLILSIILGMALHNVVGTPSAAIPGVKFGLKRVLRAGIVLLGLQLTISQVAEVGWLGVVVIVATLASTFAFTKWLGRLIGVETKLAELIAAGTSICGASAVIATNTVTRARDEDVAYAIACVTVFGSLSMVLLPLADNLLHLSPETYGLWAGASIHEVAQVVAAAFQGGDQAGHFGTIAKLTRVLMLAPVVITLGLVAARRAKVSTASGGAGVPVPWFVLGFILMIGVASSGLVPAAVMPDVVLATQFMLAIALAAMGLETDIRKLAAKGLRPALLGAAAWIFIVVFALGLILMTGAGS
ncbi:YeiH family protein [Jiella mangrovi]|uniref:YeiH family putative sulfate export transporter n=1 Tax=Jiella mangrovi TaxID=2821407 RepID=A0ABS4BFJ0_9HYPH|nr:YeiH family protein [Jiella mangrovi]MBP0614931.1 YeiH family putative sulfate export transporter [Jiella mangrovi]